MQIFDHRPPAWRKKSSNFIGPRPRSNGRGVQGASPRREDDPRKKARQVFQGFGAQGGDHVVGRPSVSQDSRYVRSSLEAFPSPRIPGGRDRVEKHQRLANIFILQVGSILLSTRSAPYLICA